MVRSNAPLPDTEEDYEAQRQANIKANLELMMSLGLYKTSSSFNPKPATPKPKPKSKSSTPTPSTSEEGEVEKRPRRITRSVSRVLEPSIRPQREKRGMKRALSDDGTFSSKRRWMQDDYNPSTFDDSDDEIDSRRPRNALNPKRQYRDREDLQRQTDRLGVRIHNPKTFGHIPGISIGTVFAKRMDASTAAIHAPTVAGISGNEQVGCWSICLSGGYEDDIDEGDIFTYTGSGGRDLKGTVNNPKNLRTAPQTRNQQWEGKNEALRVSVKTGKPVRVMRGWKVKNQWGPREGEGYVYCGLYKVTNAWMEKGKAGFKVCKFRFERLSGQAPLPTFNHDETESENEEDEEGAEAEADKSDSEPEIEIVTARSVRASNRSQNTSTPTPAKKAVATTINLTSPSPSPSPTPSNRSIRSTSSISRHPILKSPGSEFDRAQYIILSDSESDNSDGEEEEEVLLQLEIDQPEPKELLEREARRSPRKAVRNWKPIDWSRNCRMERGGKIGREAR